MGKKRAFIFLILLFYSSLDLLGQENYPPEPMMTTQEESTLSPCGSGDGGGGTVGIPPPKGLCLPINDYLLPLFISGVALGAFSLLKFQRRMGSNSIL